MENWGENVDKIYLVEDDLCIEKVVKHEIYSDILLERVSVFHCTLDTISPIQLNVARVSLSV